MRPLQAWRYLGLAEHSTGGKGGYLPIRGPQTRREASWMDCRSPPVRLGETPAAWWVECPDSEINARIGGTYDQAPPPRCIDATRAPVCSGHVEGLGGLELPF